MEKIAVKKELTSFSSSNKPAIFKNAFLKLQTDTHENRNVCHG